MIAVMSHNLKTPLIKLKFLVNSLDKEKIQKIDIYDHSKIFLKF